MHKLALILGLLFLTAPAFATCPNDANEVQSAYCEAREAVLALPENSVEQAKAWESLASKEAHAQSTATGLPGQKDGKPNYASAEAWCLNNAGYAYWLCCKGKDAIRCLEKSLATPGISGECKAKAAKNLEAAQRYAPPNGCK